MEGGYSFVAVTLTPDEGETPSEGRTLPPLYIDSDSDTLQFPARMSLTGMAEEQRTTVWVLGDSTAEISSGWSSEVLEYLYSGSDGDAEAAFDAALIEAAARDIPTYLSAYSGVYEDQWVTRFDTLAPRAVHTADPVFTFSGSDDSWRWKLMYRLLMTVVIVRPRLLGCCYRLWAWVGSAVGAVDLLFDKRFE